MSEQESKKIQESIKVFLSNYKEAVEKNLELTERIIICKAESEGLKERIEKLEAMFSKEENVH